MNDPDEREHPRSLPDFCRRFACFSDLARMCVCAFWLTHARVSRAAGGRAGQQADVRVLSGTRSEQRLEVGPGRAGATLSSRVAGKGGGGEDSKGRVALLNLGCEVWRKMRKMRGLTIREIR
eukprot:3012011-Pleurochrysis_carterae.AAC.1